MGLAHGHNSCWWTGLQMLGVQAGSTDGRLVHLIVVLAAWRLTLWPLPWVWVGSTWGPLMQFACALAGRGVQVLT